MKRYFCLMCAIVAGSLIALPVLAQTLELAWETASDLKGPESAIYDPEREIVYVSNVNGGPGDVDGNGFISKVALDGTIVELEWVSGLNAPKGLTLSGDSLYVSDINALVEIDVTNGKIVNSYQAADAKFLNDVTADSDGNIYVSDMMGNTIYRLSNGAFDVWVQSEQLDFPNGLHVEGDRLIVGSWGKPKEDFSTDVPGHLKQMSIKDGSIESLGSGVPVGNLDGIEADGKGNYYVTDWFGGKLFHIEPSGKASMLLELGQGAADHEVILDKGLVLIPMMMNNKMSAYRISD